jgi:Flp pilus assembly protein TadD
LLLVGVAGCSASPGQAPILAGKTSDSPVVAMVEGRGVEQLVRMSQRSLASGDATTAIGLAQEALSRDGSNVEAALVLGYAQLAVGAPQDAGFAFGRVLRRDPGHRDASIGYAKAMIAVGRTDAALDHLEPLVRGNAGDAQALNLLGVAHDLEGDHGRAIESYRRALAVTPDAPDVSSNLGLSLALHDQYREAIAVLRPLAEGYVSSPRARQNLALAYGLAGSLDEAERWSRMDLGESDVQNNLDYFRMIAGLAPGAVRSAALQPEFSEPPVRSAPPPRLGAAPAEAVPPSPVERLPEAIRPRAGFASDTPVVAEVGVEVASLGHWFVDLGPLSETQWRELRDRNPAETAGLRRLASGSGSGAPALVGPFDTGEAADGLCRSLGDDVAACTPVRL